VRVDELTYELKPENIAGEPIEIRLGERDLGRMLVVRRRERSIEHAGVRDLPRYLQAGDVVVFNDSKRWPGVLKTRTVRGAQIEVRLTRLLSAICCEARPYPTHFIAPSVEIFTRSGARLVVGKSSIPPYGLCTLESDTPLDQILLAEGVPITSFFYKNYWKPEHYNPVYASKEGSVESPMAGLHFTERLLDELRSNGIHIAFVTLHVVGSWLPFLNDTIESHIAQPEAYVVPEATAALIARAQSEGKRVVAVGSTSCRALESMWLEFGRPSACSSVSRLFIQPGHSFRITDAYFTNFHPARSSLMMLDAAFCPAELLLRAYNTAARESYLFHEFGDAVFFL
jgi:S-adenosylmethionine:tRNA ribosyltransferase-isomerase